MIQNKVHKQLEENRQIQNSSINKILFNNHNGGNNTNKLDTQFHIEGTSPSYKTNQTSRFNVPNTQMSGDKNEGKFFIVNLKRK